MKITPLYRIVCIFLYVPFILSFGLILVFCDILQRLGYLIAGPRGVFKAVCIQSYLLVKNLRLLGYKVIYSSVPVLLDDRPYIIISNHQSMFDIPILYMAFPSRSPKFIAKKELSRWLPGISFNLRNGHNAIIDRKDPRNSIKGILTFANLINENNYVGVIFPEGTRARQGQLRQFHGAGILALLKHTPNADIIPVCINGSWKLNPGQGCPVHPFTSISVNVGPIIPRAGVSDLNSIINQAYKYISEQLGSETDKLK